MPPLPRIQENLLDRVIGWLSPAVGARAGCMPAWSWRWLRHRAACAAAERRP